MTIHGPDISNHQGVVDIQRVKDEGYQFVFAKVTEGAGYKDPYWLRTRDWCANVGLLCIGYHYVRTDGAEAQARSYAQAGGGDTVMLDFEDGSGNIDNFWNVVNAFNGMGIRVVLTYMPDWYWERIGKPNIADVPGLLVRSEYTTGYPGDGSANWGGYGGKPTGILQWTDKATVAGKSPVDVNAWRGTIQELAAALGLAGGLLIPGLEGVYLP